MSLAKCFNFEDFRKLAKKNLPAPIFHYIDGGADDEVTLKRNTESFSQCDLVPNILTSVGEPDLSQQFLVKKLKCFFFQQQCNVYITGDLASARATEKFNTFYSMSTMATSSIEEVSNISGGPKMFQLYIFKDQN